MPDGGSRTNFKDIHSFGNPLLYWASSFAVVVVAIGLMWNVFTFFRRGQISGDFYLRLFLVTGYFASWLPWAFVSRCTFLYHYQSASIFSFLCLAWCLSWLWKKDSYGRVLLPFVGLVLCALFISFIFFLPLTLGIELEKSAFYDRMWFRSWI